jgi:hypothetical protein
MGLVGSDDWLHSTVILICFSVDKIVGTQLIQLLIKMQIQGAAILATRITLFQR